MILIFEWEKKVYPLAQTLTVTQIVDIICVTGQFFNYSVTKSKTFSPKYLFESSAIVPFSFKVFIAES